jgi:hypothetical protein
MGDRDGTDGKARGMNSWRAGCVETRTSGSEGGLRKRTGRKTGTAPQPDPYVWRDQAEHAAEPWWSAGGNVGDGFPAWAKVIVTWTLFTQTNS